MQLTGSQRRYLRGLAHDLEPVIQIGNKGVTAALLKELDQALAAHELIKVKLGRHVPDDIETCAEQIAEKTGAVIAQTIGKVIVAYRPAEDPEERRIHLPKPRKRAEEPDEDEEE